MNNESWNILINGKLNKPNAIKLPMGKLKWKDEMTQS